MLRLACAAPGIRLALGRAAKPAMATSRGGVAGQASASVCEIVRILRNFREIWGGGAKEKNEIFPISNESLAQDALELQGCIYG